MKYMTLAELVDIKGQLLRVACEDGHNACSWQITEFDKRVVITQIWFVIRIPFMSMVVMMSNAPTGAYIVVFSPPTW